MRPNVSKITTTNTLTTLKPPQLVPDVVRLVIRCLDPINKELRTRLLTPCSRILWTLVDRYPFVSFHPSQKFAVGTSRARGSVRCRLD